MGAGLLSRLSSLRLTLVLFLVLAGASLIGTMVPQGQPREEYLRIYGEVATSIIEALGITDLYHSLWFMALLGVFMVHLGACTVQRLPATWNSIRAPQRPLTDALFRSLPVARRFELAKPPEAVYDVVKNELARLGWPHKEERARGVVHLVGQKGHWSRIGAYVAHLGVMIVVLGAAVGFALGFKGFVQIPEGKAVEAVQERGSGRTVPLGFQIKCERFLLNTYPDGTPREYRSDLVFIRNGRVELEAPLRVNHPISFGGYDFYQASYGISAKVTLEATKDSTKRQIVMETGDVASLDSSGRIVLKLLRYEPDVQGRGPAALVAYLRPEGHPVTGWVFEQDSQARLEGYYLRLAGAQEMRWTGLQVKRDPGVWVVWIGFSLIIAGCCLAFLGVHRRLWIRLDSAGTKGILFIGGSSSRDIPGTSRLVEALTEALLSKGLLKKGRGDGSDG